MDALRDKFHRFQQQLYEQGSGEMGSGNQLQEALPQEPEFGGWNRLLWTLQLSNLLAGNYGSPMNWKKRGLFVSLQEAYARFGYVLIPRKFPANGALEAKLARQLDLDRSQLKAWNKLLRSTRARGD